MRHGLPLAARATAPQHESERFRASTRCRSDAEGSRFPAESPAIAKSSGQSITAPRGLLRHASAADGCAADSQSIDTIPCRSY